MFCLNYTISSQKVNTIHPFGDFNAMFGHLLKVLGKERGVRGGREPFFLKEGFSPSPEFLHPLSHLYESKLFLNLGESASRDIRSLLSTLLHLGLKLSLVGHKVLEFLLNRRECIRTDLTDRKLEVAVALAVKFALDLVESLAREYRVNSHQIIDTVLAVGIAHAGVGVGNGALEFADYGVSVIEDVDHRIGVLIRLTHLLRRIGKRHDLRARLCHNRLGNGKRVGIDRVEACRNIAAKLNVLLLIDTNGNNVGLIEQNISRHKHGISEKTCVDVVGMLLGFILELSHARKLTEAGKAVEQPCKLGVFLYVRLHVKSIFVGIKTASHVECKRLVGAAAQVGRDLTNGDRVLVNNTVKALVLHGVRGKVLDRAKIISNSQISAGLNAGKRDLLIIKHNVYPPKRINYKNKKPVPYDRKVYQYRDRNKTKFLRCHPA